MVACPLRSTFILLALAVFFTTGCASGPYQAGRGWKNASEVASAESVSPSIEIAQGRPHRFIDGVGWVCGVPSQILLWDHRANNHDVSPETIDAVASYLNENELDDVYVRVNQYAPGEEWRRLTENKNVGAGWRYTLGTLSLVHYTILPGRILGGDRYNPYTNSLYVYSDLPSLAIEKAAYAKDIHHRSYPGTYAAVNELPVVSLWHETIATNEALAYVEHCGTRDELAEARRILHPNYGSEVGGALDSGPLPVLQVGGAIVGHITGRLGNRTADEAVPGEVDLQQTSGTSELGAFEIATKAEEVPTIEATYLR